MLILDLYNKFLGRPASSTNDCRFEATPAELQQWTLRSHGNFDGTRTLTWYIANNWDKLVLVTDSVLSKDFLLTVRNGTFAKVVILSNDDEIVQWIDAELQYLTHAPVG